MGFFELLFKLFSDHPSIFVFLVLVFAVVIIFFINKADTFQIGKWITWHKRENNTENKKD